MNDLNDLQSRPRRAHRPRSLAHGIPTFVLFILWGLVAASCTSVGGKKTRVELVTVPKGGADAYVVPQDRWFAGGKDLYKAFAQANAGAAKEDARAALFAWLDAWLVRGSRTPVEVTIVAHQHAFVAAREGQVKYMEFDPLDLSVDPKTGKKPVTLELPDQGTNDGSR